MNLIDAGVLIIILVFIIYGYTKGLIMTVFRFASFFAAIALAGYLHPFVSRVLRDTPLYGMLTDAVTESMGLETFFQEHTADVGGILDSLPIPAILRQMLAANNTPDIYNLLHVETIEEYIAGFFANIIINVLAIVLVFILAWVVLSIIGSVLDLVGRLPIISTFNRVGGLAAGFILGAAVAWVGLFILGVLIATPAYEDVYAYAQGSLAARWFFDSGFTMELLTGI